MQYSAAIQEAYARSNTTIVVYDTVEFKHSALTSPLRIVAGISPITAKLEKKGNKEGIMADFTPVPFNFTHPSQGVGPTPEAHLTIDNITTDIIAVLDKVAVSFEPIKLIYRVYTADTLDHGPAITPPPILQVIHSSGDSQLTLTIKPLDLTKLKFPTETYAAE